MGCDETQPLLRIRVAGIQARFRLASLPFLGFTAREEAKPSSDVDVLVE